MLKAFCRLVDAVNEQVGSWVSLLFIPLVFFVIYEVVARYFFNAPTIWAWDVNTLMAAIIICLGAGCVLRRGAHITVDAIVTRFSPRTRAIIDLITSPVFFLAYGLLFWLAIGGTERAIRVWEESDASLFRILLWPLRVIAVIGIFLLLVQGVAKLIRDFQTATGARKENMS